MATLPFAPLPPATVRLSLGPEEWEACLDVLLTLSELTLRLPANDFSSSCSDRGSLPTFLTSFYHELGSLQPEDTTLSTPKAVSLRKACFRLVSRAYSGDGLPASLSSWGFLSDFCHAHVKSASLQQVTARLWKKHADSLHLRLQKQKDQFITALESKNIENGIQLLSRLASIMHASPDIAAFFLIGSDFLDSLVGAYGRCLLDDHKKAISTVAYLGLTSLVRTNIPNTSLLSDHLYSLKSQSDKSPPNQSLLADVVTNTALLTRLRHSVGSKVPERLFKLLDTLETYRTPSLARPRKRTSRSRSKAKGKQHVSGAELNVHRMSLVTQVQDLFPDLGSGFVLKLLDEYNDDVEQVTAHLLDESLPPYLASLNSSVQAATEHDREAHIDDLVPRSIPPPPEPFIPQRRNVFDDDELDQLDFDAGRLHIGKRNKSVTSADQPNKVAILSALAAFDSDDDERDDTYDVEDVGGTVDSAHPDGEPGTVAKVTQDENDMALFTAYKSVPQMFGRTFDVRKSQARLALKSETGMTDEQIEGWAVMLQRDPKRMKRLEGQMGAFDGRQNELASTSYRESPGGTETEDSDAAQKGGRGGFRGRGRGRGGAGRVGRGGGNVAGPSGEASTAQAQRRKEANKGSRANHNRREGRARKMARGGFPG